MGLFGGKKKYNVSNAVMRLVEDNLVPDPLLQATIYHLFRDVSFSESIQHFSMNGRGRQFERMYRWARDSDEYTYGLPDIRIFSSTSEAEAVQAVIEANVGQPVSTGYNFFRPPNHTHLALQQLTENQGYLTHTNELTVLSEQKGFPVSLVSITPTEKLESSTEADPGTLGTPELLAVYTKWGFAGFTPTLSQPYVTLPPKIGLQYTNGAEIRYSWTDAESIEHEEMLFISLEDYDPDLEYFQAEYTYEVDGETKTGYFTYFPGDGLYPSLDEVYARLHAFDGSFFPFAVFVREGDVQTAPELEGTPGYESTRKLLDFLDIDFQEFGDQVQDNKDAHMLQQALIMMGVPITGQDPVEMEYLHRFFKQVHSTLPDDIQPLDSRFFLKGGDLRRKNFDLEGAAFVLEIAEADFRVLISFDNMTVATVPGNIGAVGTYSNTVETLVTTVEIDNVGDLELNPNFTYTTKEGEILPTTYTYSTEMRVISKQVYPGVVEEIRISNIQNRYDVNFHNKGLGVVGGVNDERLLIPLDYNVCQQISIFKRERLYYRSLYFVANSGDSQTESFFSSGFFSTFIKIVGFAITLYTLGGDGGFFAALGQGLTQAAIYLAEAIIVTMTLQFALDELIALVGPEVGFLLALVAFAYGGYQSWTNGQFAQSGFADKLIKVANGLVSATENTMREMFAGIAEEIEEFNELREQKWAELEEAKDLLDTNSFLDPFLFIGQVPQTVPGESPERYYQRLVGNTNPGLLGFEFVEKFVDISLTLPSVNDTIGDTFYV